MVIFQSDAVRSKQASRDALTIIRSATASYHASLEKAIDWSVAFSSPVGYLELLRNFLRVVYPLECRLEKFEPAVQAELSQGRSRQLRCDIEAVLHGYTNAGKVDQADGLMVDVSFIVDQATALGALYVLEGSALGGQILSKQIRDFVTRWPIDEPLSALQLENTPFVDSYFVGRGAATGPHWRAFCERINHALPNEPTASTAAWAAVQTFELFHSTLTGKRVCVRP